MGRETKVGLLAGLTFITCFAVILANRGRDRFSELGAWPVVVNGLAAASGGTERLMPPATAVPPPSHAVTPAPQRTGPPVQTQFARTEQTTDRSAAGSAGGPTSSQDAAPASGGGVVLRRHPGSSPVVPLAVELVRVPEEPPRLLQAAQGSDPGEQERLLRERLARLSVGWAANASASQAANQQDSGAAQALPAVETRQGMPVLTAPPSQQAAPRPGTDAMPPVQGPIVPIPRTILAKHSVQKGDTLTAIAREYYGAATSHHIDAICDANRGVLADRHRLKVGDEVVIPAVNVAGFPGASAPGAAMPIQATPGSPVRTNLAEQKPAESPARGGGAGTVAASPSARGTAETHSAGDSSTRWYQVRKKDRYLSIARDQLGDERRWKEIFELNRDRFPDPERIREGVRIRLPVR